MKKYRTITNFGLGEIFIENFNTLEEAKRNYKKGIEDLAESVLLLEEETSYSSSGDSCNKILAEYLQ